MIFIGIKQIRVSEKIVHGQFFTGLHHRICLVADFFGGFILIQNRNSLQGADIKSEKYNKNKREEKRNYPAMPCEPRHHKATDQENCTNGIVEDVYCGKSLYTTIGKRILSASEIPHRI